MSRSRQKRHSLRVGRLYKDWKKVIIHALTKAGEMAWTSTFTAARVHTALLLELIAKSVSAGDTVQGSLQTFSP